MNIFVNKRFGREVFVLVIAVVLLGVTVVGVGNIDQVKLLFGQAGGTAPQCVGEQCGLVCYKNICKDRQAGKDGIVALVAQDCGGLYTTQKACQADPNCKWQATAVSSTAALGKCVGTTTQTWSCSSIRLQSDCVATSVAVFRGVKVKTDCAWSCQETVAQFLIAKYTSGVPVKSFPFLLTGFSPNEIVRADFVTPKYQFVVNLVDQKADGKGRVSVTLVATDSWLVGDYTLDLKGQTSGKTVSRKFNFAGAPSPAGPAAVPNATIGNTVATYQMSFRGFAPNEAVSTWVTFGSGVSAALPNQMADSTGGVNFTVAAKDNWPSGGVRVVAHGRSSGHEEFKDFQFNQPQVPVASGGVGGGYGQASFGPSPYTPGCQAMCTNGQKCLATCSASTPDQNCPSLCSNLALCTATCTQYMDAHPPPLPRNVGVNLDEATCHKQGGAFQGEYFSRWRPGNAQTQDNGCNDIQCASGCCFDSCQCGASCPPPPQPEPAPAIPAPGQVQLNNPENGPPDPNTAAGAGTKAWGDCIQRGGDVERCRYEAQNAYLSQYDNLVKQAKGSPDPQKALVALQQQNVTDAMEDRAKLAAACTNTIGQNLTDRSQCLKADGSQYQFKQGEIKQIVQAAADAANAGDLNCLPSSPNFQQCVATVGRGVLNPSVAQVPGAGIGPAPSKEQLFKQGILTACGNVKGVVPFRDYGKCYDCTTGLEADCTPLVEPACKPFDTGVQAHTNQSSPYNQCLKDQIASILQSGRTIPITQLQTNYNYITTGTECVSDNSFATRNIAGGLGAAVTCPSSGKCALGECVSAVEALRRSTQVANVNDYCSRVLGSTAQEQCYRNNEAAVKQGLDFDPTRGRAVITASQVQSSQNCKDGKAKYTLDSSSGIYYDCGSGKPVTTAQQQDLTVSMNNAVESCKKTNVHAYSLCFGVKESVVVSGGSVDSSGQVFDQSKNPLVLVGGIPVSQQLAQAFVSQYTNQGAQAGSTQVTDLGTQCQSGQTSGCVADVAKAAVDFCTQQNARLEAKQSYQEFFQYTVGGQKKTAYCKRFNSQSPPTSGAFEQVDVSKGVVPGYSGPAVAQNLTVTVYGLPVQQNDYQGVQDYCKNNRYGQAYYNSNFGGRVPTVVTNYYRCGGDGAPTRVTDWRTFDDPAHQAVVCTGDPKCPGWAQSVGADKQVFAGAFIRDGNTSDGVSDVLLKFLAENPDAWSFGASLPDCSSEVNSAKCSRFRSNLKQWMGMIGVPADSLPGDCNGETGTGWWTKGQCVELANFISVETNGGTRLARSIFNPLQMGIAPGEYSVQHGDLITSQLSGLAGGLLTGVGVTGGIYGGALVTGGTGAAAATSWLGLPVVGGLFTGAAVGDLWNTHVKQEQAQAIMGMPCDINGTSAENASINCGGDKSKESQLAQKMLADGQNNFNPFALSDADRAVLSAVQTGNTDTTTYQQFQTLTNKYAGYLATAQTGMQTVLQLNQQQDEGWKNVVATLAFDLVGAGEVRNIPVLTPVAKGINAVFSLPFRGVGLLALGIGAAADRVFPEAVTAAVGNGIRNATRPVSDFVSGGGMAGQVRRYFAREAPVGAPVEVPVAGAPVGQGAQGGGIFSQHGAGQLNINVTNLHDGDLISLPNAPGETYRVGGGRLTRVDGQVSMPLRLSGGSVNPDAAQLLHQATNYVPAQGQAAALAPVQPAPAPVPAAPAGPGLAERISRGFSDLRQNASDAISNARDAVAGLFERPETPVAPPAPVAPVARAPETYSFWDRLFGGEPQRIEAQVANDPQLLARGRAGGLQPADIETALRNAGYREGSLADGVRNVRGALDRRLALEVGQAAQVQAAQQAAAVRAQQVAQRGYSWLDRLFGEPGRIEEEVAQGISVNNVGDAEIRQALSDKGYRLGSVDEGVARVRAILDQRAAAEEQAAQVALRRQASAQVAGTGQPVPIPQDKQVAGIINQAKALDSYQRVNFLLQNSQQLGLDPIRDLARAGRYSEAADALERLVNSDPAAFRLKIFKLDNNFVDSIINDYSSTNHGVVRNWRQLQDLAGILESRNADPAVIKYIRDLANYSKSTNQALLLIDKLSDSETYYQELSHEFDAWLSSVCSQNISRCLSEDWRQFIPSPMHRQLDNYMWGISDKPSLVSVNAGITPQDLGDALGRVKSDLAGLVERVNPDLGETIRNFDPVQTIKDWAGEQVQNLHDRLPNNFRPGVNSTGESLGELAASGRQVGQEVVDSTSFANKVKVLGGKNPTAVDVSSPGEGDVVLYHGSNRSLTVKDNYDFTIDPSADGSQTLGFGLYLTDDPEAARSYANVRGGEKLVSVGVPYKARMLDLRTDGALPEPLFQAWRKYWKNYYDDNISIFRQKADGGSMLAEVQRDLLDNYSAYLDKIASDLAKRDVRLVLGDDLKNGRSSIDPSGGGEQRFEFSKFMRSQGFDGLISKEAVEGLQGKEAASYVFYNYEKVGTIENWTQRAGAGSNSLVGDAWKAFTDESNVLGITPQDPITFWKNVWKRFQGYRGQAAVVPVSAGPGGFGQTLGNLYTAYAVKAAVQYGAGPAGQVIVAVADLAGAMWQGFGTTVIGPTSGVTCFGWFPLQNCSPFALVSNVNPADITGSSIRNYSSNIPVRGGTRTNTPTRMNTPTNTRTTSPTQTNAPTSTQTNSPTNTNSPTQTNTPTSTQTNSPTTTQTNTPTTTETETPTPTFTPEGRAIYDCGGKTIDVPAGQCGITISGRHGATVQNCNFVSSTPSPGERLTQYQNYGGGVCIESSSDVIISDITFSGGVTGIRVVNSDSVLVKGATNISATGWGVQAIDSTGVAVAGGTYQGYRPGGLESACILYYNTSNGQINNATCNKGGDGIYLLRGSDGNAVSGNTIVEASANCLEGSFSSNNVYSGNTCQKSDYAVWLGHNDEHDPQATDPRTGKQYPLASGNTISGNTIEQTNHRLPEVPTGQNNRVNGTVAESGFNLLNLLGMVIAPVVMLMQAVLGR